MPTGSQPFFLIVQAPPAVAGEYLRAAGPLVSSHGGKVLVSASSAIVEALEQGTPPAGILIAEFKERDAIEAFWESSEHQSAAAFLNVAEGALAIGATGLPYEGLPEMLDIPTTASVTPPDGRGPRHYMLIQGVGTDQARLDQYRDIILPMLKEQGAYYTLFEIDGNVNFFLGHSPYTIFAISRWPDHAAGHAFWDSDRYQNTAIPIRTGAGEFWVHFAEGLDG